MGGGRGRVREERGRKGERESSIIDIVPMIPIIPLKAYDLTVIAEALWFSGKVAKRTECPGNCGRRVHERPIMHHATDHLPSLCWV